jgi:voltage-gated potassium channel
MNTAIRTLIHIRYGIAILVAILLAGTIGYYVLEGLTPLQALYSSVLVISTLGLHRAPNTSGGMVLTIALIVTGVGTLFYILGQVAETVIESAMGSVERRMNRQISAMQAHTIICGFGRVGLHAATDLARERRPFVVVDSDPDAVDRARADGYIAMQGNATDDHVLQAAGVERAASLLITTPHDAANVFITLSARAFNQDLFIVARASEDSTEAKLEKAGADEVIAPETIGGRRMAALIVRPDVADVVDNLISSQSDEGWLDQTRVQPGSSLTGKRIREAGIYRETGATIIAIRRKDGQTVLNPGGDEYIREGDILISVGARDEIDQLEQITNSGEGEQRP